MEIQPSYIGTIKIMLSNGETIRIEVKSVNRKLKKLTVEFSNICRFWSRRAWFVLVYEMLKRLIDGHSAVSVIAAVHPRALSSTAECIIERLSDTAAASFISGMHRTWSGRVCLWLAGRARTLVKSCRRCGLMSPQPHTWTPVWQFHVTSLEKSSTPVENSTRYRTVL